MEIFFFWIGGAIATGMFASIRRNRNGFAWFALALVISPIFAFAFCAILKAKPETSPLDAVTRHPDFSELPQAEQERLTKIFSHRQQPKSFTEDLMGKSTRPSKWHINPDNFGN